MFRSTTLAAALALLSLSGVASAHDGAAGDGEHAHGARKLPMPAAEFRAHVEAREAARRAHLERRLAAKNVAADEAARRRAAFEAGVAQVRAKLDEVCADGTVTRDEARAVREVAHQVMPHHHHHEHAPRG